MKSINFIEEEECPKHSSSLDIPDFRDIYHGCMSREVSVKTLRASGRDKCYLVRKRINADENCETLEYILSFVHKDEDYHFKINKENKYFIFANRYFPSFKCVISHYMVSNIISDAHLEFGVVNKTITAVRESLRGQRCYLVENVSDERMKEFLCNDTAGTYLFRPRTEDINQFVLMFFDGNRIHKLKMDVRLLDRKAEIIGDGDEEDSKPEPMVAIVLGKNYFESWRDLVDNFSVNPIVKVNPGCVDKLVKEVNVNRNVHTAEQEDIYRQYKFNNALQQTDVYSIHGEVAFSEGPKIKWKQSHAYVDKDHGHLIIKNSNKANYMCIELLRCKFIPVHYSVHQKYCFVLLLREQVGTTKQYFLAMVDGCASPSCCPSSSSSSPQSSATQTQSQPPQRENQPEETYAYRQYNLGEHDKEVYHSTEAEKNTDVLLCRAYDRWTVAVKRHCSNTKDDAANEENPERHSKLHRYNRRLKLQIGHSGGAEMSLTDNDLAPMPVLNTSSSQFGQFEVIVGTTVIATVPRKPDGAPQTILFQDLPANIDDVSVSIRVKGSKRKEFIKELCTHTIAHPELVPRQCPHPVPSQTVESCPGNSILVASSSLSLMPSSIQSDPPSCCGPVTVDCYATIEYKELIILPFSNYKSLSKCLMENVRQLFSNTHFSLSFSCASEMPEFKKLLNCFLYMAIWEKKQVEFLYVFFEKDLKALEPNLYFRQNTVANKLFYDYVSLFASNWLVSSFLQFFEEIYNRIDLLNNAELNLEETGANHDPNEKQYTPDETIYNCLAAALSGINQNLEQCPLTLRQLFHKLQSEIKSQNADGDDCIHYRLLTNLVMLRFFCAILNSRGEQQNDFFRKITDSIMKKNDPKYKDFLKIFNRPEVLNDFLVKISRLLLQTYSAGKGPSAPLPAPPPPTSPDDINGLIREYRDRTLYTVNEDLTRPLQRAELDRLPSQLDFESKAICRQSLSRRFNDVLEFLTRLREEPTAFLGGKTRLDRSDILPPALAAVVDDINEKKACGGGVVVERL